VEMVVVVVVFNAQELGGIPFQF